MDHSLLQIMFVACYAIVAIKADMKPDESPPDIYQQCFGRMKKRTDCKRTPCAEIQTACDNYYMWHNAKNTIIYRKMTKDQENYISHLQGEVMADLYNHRVKRQAGTMGMLPRKNLPVRKEIRMMTERERALFFKAVNSAKRNTTILPNKYDAIANIHTGITAVSAHGGCNFHGWHRMYAHIFERALREEGPEFADLTLPYWDTRLEARMNRADPDSYMPATRSALFSERLMGTCEGEVKGGIMRNGWNSTVGVIVRNCGTDGPLITDEMVYNVTRQKRMRDICGEDSQIENDLEHFHNGGHRFIDGQMQMLSTSVYDPIFWVLHVFVDLVWEYFRQNSKAHGYDISTDYPTNPTIMGAHELQIPDASMGFPSSNMTVIHGLSEMFTEEHYTYAPPPTCTVQKPDCGSKYLKCVVDRPPGARQRRAMCVARTLEEVIEWEKEQNKPKPEPCPEPKPTPKPKPHPKPKPPPVPKETPHPPQGSIKPYQNTFCMNGKSDSGQWAYFPLKIIVRRPPEYKNYGSYPVERGHINKLRGDIYSPSAYSNIYRHLRNPDKPATYVDCQAPDEPTNEIYIKSVGMNYEGIYKEYAIIDRRLAVTVATAYIAVRKPTSDVDESIAMLHAQDKCGRVCKPICKVPGTEVFRPCSGAVKLTGKRPLMFGNSFGDAVLDMWDFDTDKSCPQLTTTNVMISFYCDYKADWIWPTMEPPKPARFPRPTTPLPPHERTTVTAGCTVGYRCTVNHPCHKIRPCVHGKYYECLSACHAYAVCVRGTLYLTYCTRGETYDSKSGQCVPGYCNVRKSGIRNPKGRRAKLNSKRRRFMG